MRRAFIILSAFLIAGCAAIQNPVNTTQLAQVEASYGVALSIAVGYRSLPLCRTGTRASYQNVCAQRSVILKLQAADRNAQAALLTARSFVHNNPTVSAFTILQTAQDAISNFRAVEAQNGVN